MTKELVLSLFLPIMIGLSSAVYGSDLMDCGNLNNHYGPFDYTNAQHRAEKMPIVVRAHFTAQVESLTRGQTAVKPGHDIDYTLRAFPNHHRALHSMARYQIKSKQSPPPGAQYSAECYFERAMRFNPSDGMVKMIYGIFLHQIGDYDEAVVKYRSALALAPESAEIHYNLGLALFDLGELADAAKHAKAAYKLGYPLPGLRNKLLAKGESID
ncbi:MAG: tetratricopeptide repeat protein [Pseudomonadota bacterium]